MKMRFASVLMLAILVLQGIALKGTLLLTHNPATWKSGKLFLYNLENGETDTLSKNSVYGACFSPSGKKVAFTNDGGGQIQILDLATGKLDSIMPVISNFQLSWSDDSCIYWGNSRSLYRVHPITQKVDLVYQLRMNYSPIASDTQNAGFYTGHMAASGKRGAFVLWSDQIGNRSVSFDIENNTELAINDGAATRTSCQASISADGAYVATSNYNHSVGLVKRYNSNSTPVYEVYMKPLGIWMIRFSHDPSYHLVFKNSADSALYHYELTSDTSVYPDKIIKGPNTWDYDTRGWVKDFITPADSVRHLARFLVTPASALLEPGQSAQFSTVAQDEKGAAYSTGSSWSVKQGGSVTSSGLFQNNGDTGTFAVSATVDGRPDLTAQAWVRVEPKNLALGKAAGSSSSTFVSQYSLWNRSYLTNGIVVSQVGTRQEGGWTSICHATQDTTEWVQIDLGSDMTFNQVVLYPQIHNRRADGKACYFPVNFTVEAKTSAGENETLFNASSYPPPDFGAAQIFNFNPINARYVKINATRLGYSAEKNCFRFQLLEFKVLNILPNSVSRNRTTELTDIPLKAIPNPFRHTVNIVLSRSAFSESASGVVEIYNLSGRLLAVYKTEKRSLNLTLAENESRNKWMSVSGVYLCRLKTQKAKRTIRLLVTR